jgi:hypothetical protein
MAGETGSFRNHLKEMKPKGNIQFFLIPSQNIDALCLAMSCCIRRIHRVEYPPLTLLASPYRVHQSWFGHQSFDPGSRVSFRGDECFGSEDPMD